MSQGRSINRHALRIAQAEQRAALDELGQLRAFAATVNGQLVAANAGLQQALAEQAQGRSNLAGALMECIVRFGSYTGSGYELQLTGKPIDHKAKPHRIEIKGDGLLIIASPIRADQDEPEIVKP